MRYRKPKGRRFYRKAIGRYLRAGGDPNIPFNRMARLGSKISFEWGLTPYGAVWPNEPTETQTPNGATKMFFMQTRQSFRVETFQTLELALAAGFSLGFEFDVSAPSGALVWVWEQRA